MSTNVADHVMSELEIELTGVKCRIHSCLDSLRDEDGRTKTRELALAATKLQEASMWIDEHLRTHP